MKLVTSKLETLLYYRHNKKYVTKMDHAIIGSVKSLKKIPNVCLQYIPAIFISRWLSELEVLCETCGEMWGLWVRTLGKIFPIYEVILTNGTKAGPFWWHIYSLSKVPTFVLKLYNFPLKYLAKLKNGIYGEIRDIGQNIPLS